MSIIIKIDTRFTRRSEKKLIIQFTPGETGRGCVDQLFGNDRLSLGFQGVRGLKEIAGVAQMFSSEPEGPAHAWELIHQVIIVNFFVMANRPTNR